MSEQEESSQEGIAIVGMAGRFPGSRNIAEYWDNLQRGVDSITTFSRAELEAAGVDPALLDHPAYVRAAGVLRDVDLFDAAFFNLSPREAELTDPQYRLFLETAWEALEHAGYDSEAYEGSIGIFGGMGTSKYLLYNLLPNRELLDAAGPLQTRILNDKDFLIALAAYKLNLTGPSVTVQTACSTSLVAACIACQSLMSFQCDMALVGGVAISVPQPSGYLGQDGVFAPDGRVRAFDAGASGTVDGNGVGVVALKRLSDALADGDTIHAVIKGFATNNDGSFKTGFTAPSVDGQMEAIALAQAVAGVTADSITLIEAHGTGTPLGDPIEVAALREVFESATEKKGFCAIGSVKTNIGHLDAAAGVASLIKATLAVREGVLPPSLHFETPNPEIDFESSPFYVNTRLAPWRTDSMPRIPRRAGVSSFSLGGVNSHVILEEPPAAPPSAPAARPWQVLTLSARSRSALDALTGDLASHLAGSPDLPLADAAYTLHRGRRPFEHRRILVARSTTDGTADAAKALAARDPKRLLDGKAGEKDRPVAFLFPGLGNHYPGMAAGLYQHEPVFRAEVDRAAELLKPLLGLDLRGLLFPETGAASAGQLDLRRMVRGGGAQGAGTAGTLLRTALSQPAVFVLEHALVRLWMHWGVEPQAMLGFSIGEYVAACLAGVMSLEDALRLVTARAAAIEKLPDGAMLAVPLGEAAVAPWLGDGIFLAAVAAPEVSVLAGPPEAVAELERRLAAEGRVCRRLETSHAFHTPLLKPAAVELEALVRGLDLHPPELPFLSNVTGTWIRPEEATDPAYWTRHLLGTVRFADGVAELLRDSRRVLLEVGPGQTLSSWALQSGRGENVVALASLRHAHDPREDEEVLLGTLGQLWLEGAAIDWRAFHEGEERRRVPLPTYPFERRRYWIDAPKVTAERVAAVTESRPRELADWFHVPSWRQSPAPAAPAEVEKKPWLLLLDRHGVGERLLERLRESGVPATTLTLDERPHDAEGWQVFLRGLGAPPAVIVHLWDLDENLGFLDLLELVRAWDALGAEPPRIEVVTSRLQNVMGDERTEPEKAVLLGACSTLPLEIPGLRCRCVDLPASAEAEVLAGWLSAELASERNEPVVAWRGGRRWVRHFEPLPLPAAPTRLREGGVYLITGGLDGLGLELAGALARRARARLVLVDRAEPSAEQAVLLRAIEEAGGGVLLLRADLTDPESMRRAVAAARERFGRIDGVVHAASAGPIRLERLPSRESAGAVISGKVRDTLALAEALRDDPPGFLVLFSSLGGIAGAWGLVAHAAASAFLDAWAQAGGLSPRTFTLTVDWDVQEIQPEDGIEAFERLLSLSVTSPQVLVSPRELEQILERAAHPDLAQPEERSAEATGRHPRPELRVAYAAPRSELEAHLAAMWAEMLRLDRVGVHDNFFDLGGDSLLATRMIATIGQELGAELALRTVFEAPTVAELAAAVVGKQAEAFGGEELGELMAELDGLSPEEIEALLRSEAEAEAQGEAGVIS